VNVNYVKLIINISCNTSFCYDEMSKTFFQDKLEDANWS